MFEHFQFLDGFEKRRFIKLAANFGIVQPADGNRRAIFAANHALKQVQQFCLPIIDAAKIRAAILAAAPGAEDLLAQLEADIPRPTQTALGLPLTLSGGG